MHTSTCYSCTHLLFLLMFELGHLHSLLSPKTSQKNKKLMDICLSERVIKVSPFKIKMKESICQRTSLFPNDGSQSEFDRRDIVFIPHFWPLLLFFILSIFALCSLLFITFSEMDFQKWSFRIFIHISLN